MWSIPFLGLGIALGILGAFIEKRWPSLAVWWYGTWMVLSVISAALAFAERRWGWAALGAANAIINGIWWWQRRKRSKRRRARALMGAKSRALIAKLVTRQREATVPVRYQST